ncbi:hypothetical protein TcCL_Unassigned05927, partial [Trypanosoma cruzi]
AITESRNSGIPPGRGYSIHGVVGGFTNGNYHRYRRGSGGCAHGYSGGCRCGCEQERKEGCRVCFCIKAAAEDGKEKGERQVWRSLHDDVGVTAAGNSQRSLFFGFKPLPPVYLCLRKCFSI